MSNIPLIISKELIWLTMAALCAVGEFFSTCITCRAKYVSLLQSVSAFAQGDHRRFRPTVASEVTRAVQLMLEELVWWSYVLLSLSQTKGCLDTLRNPLEKNGQQLQDFHSFMTVKKSVFPQQQHSHTQKFFILKTLHFVQKSLQIFLVCNSKVNEDLHPY